MKHSKALRRLMELRAEARRDFELYSDVIDYICNANGIVIEKAIAEHLDSADGIKNAIREMRGITDGVV